MLRRVLIALFVLVPPRFARSQNLARIYVYAQRETPLRSWQLVQCDGAPIAKIKRGTFFAINVTPGRHVLSSSNGIPSFVDVHVGEESFIRLDWQREAGRPATLVLDKVASRVARNEMRFVLYIDSKQALSGSVPKTDPRPAPEVRFKSREDQPLPEQSSNPK